VRRFADTAHEPADAMSFEWVESLHFLKKGAFLS
jgi:hypothetical protein